MTQALVRDSLFSAWLFELAAIAISIGGFIAIFVVLYVSDGKPMQSWNNVTINTLISGPATVIRVFSASAIASCLGQWKWLNTLNSPKPLSQFAYVDDASRGPYGGLRVLLNINPWYVFKVSIHIRHGQDIALLIYSQDIYMARCVNYRSRAWRRAVLSKYNQF
jgi:heme/copper-type cytochrome/quinol oxidase subunit 2